MKIARNHGTAKQFKDAVENKLNDLSSSVTAASDTDNKDEYIHELIESIDAELDAYFDSITFDNNNDALIITTVLDSEVNEFNVPYADLKFNNAKRDTQFVCNEIEEEVNTEYVDECTDIKAASDTTSVYNAVLAELESTGVDTSARETKKYIDKVMPAVLNEYNGDAKAWFNNVMHGYITSGDDSALMEVLDLPHVPDDIDDYSEYPDNSELADRLEREVLAKLSSVGVDTNTEEAQWYMDGAVDLILQDDDHDVETWWKETLDNYKDEIDTLPHVR